MHLLDTDTLTFYFADHVRVVQRVRALVDRAVLVTRNLKDFRRVPNLQLANWVD